ncbi:MAG TPA: hypothetical protein VK420_04140, partial [Longimicrobium sp.]|nr:hypothetical protein [Longimicrobium sp.]
FLHTRPVDETVYRLGDGDLWPKDPTLGGFLGGAIGCATGAIVGRMVSSAEQRTRNTWAGCLWVGVVGVGAGSGWRVPGRFRQH